jgi:AcrR family transcriptional regulator
MLAMLPAHLPKQARSRLTLHRLLSAAEALLEHGGLEAATVPAIAKAAGVSVGVVYRRFPDKDMLLRAVYERFFTTLAEQNLARLSSVGAMQLPLPSLARGIVLGIAEGYRRKRGLLRALSQYAKTHPDPAFRKVAQRMNRATMNAIVALLLSRREEIRHPDPETAIEFGLITVAAVLHAVILDEERLQGLRAPRNADEELVKMFLAYLETNPTSRALRSKRS